MVSGILLSGPIPDQDSSSSSYRWTLGYSEMATFKPPEFRILGWHGDEWSYVESGAGVIKWLKTNAEPHTECAAKLMLVAAAQGDQDLWSGYTYCIELVLMEPKEPHKINIIGWAVEQGLARPRDRTVAVGADHGRLEILKWLYDEMGERRMGTAFEKPAQSGDLEMPKWLHESRCEGCSTAVLDGAAREGFLEVVQWLRANRSEGCTTAAMDKAASFGLVEIVKWLHLHRSEGCTFAAMDSAAENGHSDVVTWLGSNRSEGCLTTAMDTAAARCHLELVQRLHSNRREGCSVAALNRTAGNGHLIFIFQPSPIYVVSQLFPKVITSGLSVLSGALGHVLDGLGGLAIQPVPQISRSEGENVE
ncbi:hypothetical protein PHMEG_0009999 [Phytophthora megakarya]|uniref:Ankyrin repeat-containing domain n=1 Tax=Phytophthora megakarya TaxID=4795 RepID=A0A225WG44_9STRA|nr:hypothetical protein PHMEG_0009999 [Phytophthora megakarya]